MNQREHPQELLRPEEAARRLAVSRTVLFDLVLGGRIDSVKIGRSRRIPASALQKFIESLSVESVNSKLDR